MYVDDVIRIIFDRALPASPGRLLAPSRLVLLVAAKAEFFSGSIAEPQEPGIVGAVRIVAASAVERPVRAQGVSRLRGAGRPCGEMRPVRDAPMAREADLRGFFQEQGHLVRRVRTVACRAFARGNRRMDGLPGKAGLVVAGEAQGGKL